MKGIIRTKAGKDLSTMKVQNLTNHTKLNANELQIEMCSSRVNPVDIDLMKGMPFIKYNSLQIGGIDGSGKIIEVGENIQNFKKGDDVFFYRKFTDIGTWAEQIIINQKDVALIPKNISIEDAGAITLPLLTAYDALSQLQVSSNQTILIHGAGGGVGFQAVQLAISKGMSVIATAGEQDMEILKSVGVKKIFNYKIQDFSTELEKQSIDYIFDTVGKDTLLKSIQLQPKKVVSVHYLDSKKMRKTGIKVPSILQWLMKLSMIKFRKIAQKNNVEIIGQVTGADGDLLKKASEQVENIEYVVRKYTKISLSEIEKKGMKKEDVGKVILFKK